MDYVVPSEVVSDALNAATKKASLSARDMLIRGALAGVFLGYATSLVFVALSQGLPALVGAIIFPVGFVMLVLLGFELATGNFALLPAALLDQRITRGAMLRNWVVTVGTMLAFASRSTIGKIAAMWLPITIFFAHGYEHSIVNMFVIPAGMFLGAHVSMGQWWWWNQIPVTLGNMLAGTLFTGIALWYTYAGKQEYVTRPSKARSSVAVAAGD